MGKSRTLGVHTESGLRFERGVDCALQEQALERATALIVDICGGQVGPSSSGGIKSHGAHTKPNHFE